MDRRSQSLDRCSNKSGFDDDIPLPDLPKEQHCVEIHNLDVHPSVAEYLYSRMNDFTIEMNLNNSSNVSREDIKSLDSSSTSNGNCDNSQRKSTLSTSTNEFYDDEYNASEDSDVGFDFDEELSSAYHDKSPSILRSLKSSTPDYRRHYRSRHQRHSIEQGEKKMDNN